MEKMILLGDEAIARGAMDAGLSGVYAYPGTPSTEITEYVQQNDRKGELHSGWSANEKTALEDIIRDMIEVRPGEIWYATQGNGILASDENGYRKLGYAHGLRDEIVLSLFKDRNGTIWCGTFVEGLFIYRDGTFQHVENNLDYEPIAEKFLEDRIGRLWIKSFDEVDF